MNKSIWMHPKHPNRQYQSQYEVITVNKNTKASFEQTLFVLTATLKNGKTDSQEFSSFHAAKKAGWVKVK